MNLTHMDIQVRIQQARRARSDALGVLLIAGWKQSRQHLGNLLLRRAPRRFPWLETPA